MPEIPCDDVIHYTVEYKDYKNLRLHERLAINAYMLGNDTQLIQSILTENEEISKSMRRFIADMISGKIKREASKQETTIHHKIALCREIDALAKGKAQDKAVAVGIIAAREHRSSEAINTRYYEGKKAIKADRDALLKYMIDNYHPKGEK